MFNLVTGPGRSSATRSPATRHVNGVAFIGSTATGRLVAAAAAGKATLLEMGGNGPVVLLDDGDVDAAVEATLTACFLCAGQSCTAGERILVHRAVYDEYVEKLAKISHERIILGDPFDDATTMGPLNNEGVATKMDEHVADALERGARGAHRRERGPALPDGLLLGAHCAGRRAGRRARVPRGDAGPVAPVAEMTSLDRPSSWPTTPPMDSWSAIYTADWTRAWVRRRGAHRLGEHQRVHQLLGGPPPFRRPRRDRHRLGGLALTTSCSPSRSCRRS